MQQETVNTFLEGLVQDINPLITPNNALTYCLNGTILTYNGNEMVLLNDMGNGEIITDSVSVTVPGKIVGVATLNGVAYLAIYKENGNCEIGTFPSYNGDNLKYKYVYDTLPTLKGKTVYFNFDLKHPVEIELLQSYNNSVNIIITDDRPRLINSGFSVLEGGICKRTEYSYSFTNKDLFDIQTSLNKRTLTISKVTSIETYHGGDLGVGNYTFYFKYSDSDDNESDYFCESKTISVYKGYNSNINGGISLLNSGKGIAITISDCDTAYNDVKVFYTKRTSDYTSGELTYLYKLTDPFPIVGTECNIVISGNEASTALPVSELLLLYYDIESAKTMALALNKLFLANLVDSTDDDYKNLIEYSDNIDINFSYELNDDDEVGYHYGELYRFGIVYILNDGTLSATYNVGHNKGVVRAIPENESFSFSLRLKVNFTFNGTPPSSIIGYFFVRQKRIPTLITLMYVTNLNRYGRLPMLKFRELDKDGNILEGEHYCLESFLKNTSLNYQTLLSELESKKDSVMDGYDFELLPEGEYNYGELCTRETCADSESDPETYYFGDADLEYVNMRVNASNTIYEITKPVVKITLSTGMRLRIGKGDSTDPAFYWMALLGTTCLQYIDAINRVNPDAHVTIETVIQECLDIWNNRYPDDLASIVVFTWIYKEPSVDLSEVSTEQEVRNAFHFLFVGLSTTDYASADDSYNPYEDEELTKGAISVTNGTVTAEESRSIISFYFTLTDKYMKDTSYSVILSKLAAIKANLIDSSKYETNMSFAAYCPEYFLDLPYYNSIFSGGEFQVLQVTSENDGLIHTQNAIRQYKQEDSPTLSADLSLKKAKIVAVPDGISGNYIGNYIFKSKAGSAETAYFTVNPLSAQKYGYNTNLVRGNFSAYLGVLFDDDVQDPLGLWNIYIPGYSEERMEEYENIRKLDRSPYYTISDRNPITLKSCTCYRGDCYIKEYSLRINRNFNDPNAPYNDIIIDALTFNNYMVNFLTDYVNMSTDEKNIADINLGDVNAVLLGSWITFTSHATINTLIRSIDESNVTEYLESGHNRAFYPYESFNVTGNTKMPESTVFNKGFLSILGSKYSDPPLDEDKVLNTYYKDRIVYSDTYTNKSYMNGYRVFRGDSYEDYTTMYGSITKLLEYNGNLMCVFEHAVALLPIKERVLSGEGVGGNVFINNTRILPEVPMIVSDTYGSKWADSVIKTPKAIYGIDTDLKKVWMVAGLGLKLISDFKVEYFLLQYLQPITLQHIGLGSGGNIKTHYNSNKGDVMFTFYLNNGPRWNLCLNEILDKWTTFYSWIPEQSFNINNVLISTELDSSLENVKLWKHNSTNKEILSTITPTKWYGNQCPFEFEFVVTDNPQALKIFNNLQIIGNKAAPDSFHYTVTGECYTFGEDLESIYILLEKTKKELGLSYDSNYADLTIPSKFHYYKFPLYYERQDKDTELFNWYAYKEQPDYEFSQNSGTEVINRTDLKLLFITQHCLAKDITKVGRVYGNMHYKENKWDVQINPIVTMESNGEREFTEYIPLVPKSNLSIGKQVDELHWGKRRESKVRDKFMIIRVRYTGEDLAVISAIKTLYDISYA